MNGNREGDRTLVPQNAWASQFNEKVEAGIDPCEEIRAEKELELMTVKRAHGLYMVAVEEGRASRLKRKNKPRTISDKQEIYDRDIAPNSARCRSTTLRRKTSSNSSSPRARKLRSGPIASPPS